MRTIWWQRARLRTDEDDEIERHVSWLELFFDLVFVVVIARLSHDLAQDVTPGAVVGFCLQFGAVFWAWNGFTYYVERFESDGLENRLFTFVAMAAVAALAVWTEDGLGAGYGGFIGAYLATRAVNMVQWVRAACHEPVFRPVAVRFVGGFLSASVLLLLAIDLEGWERRLLFGTAVLVEILTPTLTLRRQSALPRISASKFPERFGQLTIIVLGEAIVGVVTGLGELNHEHRLGVIQALDGLLGLAVGFGLWWVYFDFIARRPPRPRFGAALGWVYLHLVVLVAITATGAAISLSIGESAGVRAMAGHVLLGSAVAVALVGLALLELTLDRGPDEPTHARLSPSLKVLCGAVAALTSLVPGWPTTALLVVLLVLLVVPALYGVVVWYGIRPAPDPSAAERQT
ncbi:low temperature requirement protein A [Kribbella kalugense]|uniref:Low temperature requirement protein LtrA n=1 Tax=Kribbella kalugense TaxID=2512221 RepID=A0A4V6Q8J2_9ACTN|nr:low temperature requirement protein A [Kribbella kalugense]TDW24294.1 low temperature requirement protein LtrA [Kribbella kalugense]